jgi:hypothetical protein
MQANSSVVVDKYRIVSTATSGFCFVIITVESVTCNMTCRHGQITANFSAVTCCSRRPEPLTLTYELTKLWYFSASCKNSTNSVECYSLRLRPRGATVSDMKLRSFYPTSQAIFMFTHSYSLLFPFHISHWPQSLQPSYIIDTFSPPSRFRSHLHILQSSWRWR